MEEPKTPLPNFSRATLYVGNLHVDVNEIMLFEKFSAAGPILSVRVCRDLISDCSLGYAYVNFQDPADAARARESFNYDLIKGCPIRIMWSQRNPFLRKSGKGNVVIKNLHPEITDKVIFDTFSAFGNVLSCKVSREADGTSKGHGFVHFESEETAKNAISKVNGMLFNGQKVFAGFFIPRLDRKRLLGEDVNRQLTNLYVQNLPDFTDEVDLRLMFGKFGKITSLRLMRDAAGASRGFGFVCFENPKNAETAVEQLNGRQILGGRPINVNHAQRKIQRHTEMNLYIKNLDTAIDDEHLYNLFSRFGTITSAKVMKENNRSRGFGFVCFSSSEEATEAMSATNGKLMGSNLLYVGIAQLKDERQAYLRKLMDNSRMQPTSPERGVYKGPVRSSSRSPYRHMQCNDNPPRSPNQLKPCPNSASVRNQPRQEPVPFAQNRAGIGNAAPIQQATQEPLTVTTLANATHERQKQMLGERLFLLVKSIIPDLAAKITGMLLEIDNTELLLLLEDEGSFIARVKEAVAVLQAQECKRGAMRQSPRRYK